MDSMSPAESSDPRTLLASYEVSLRFDPGLGRSAVAIHPMSVSDRIGRDVALIISSLLFVQRQIRSLSDSSRFAAIASLSAACVSARDGRVVRPAVTSNAQVGAIYQVNLLANGNFHIKVDQKLDGIVADTAGSLTAGGVALEILATTTDPYRAFFRQMIESATSYWRDRRSSSEESTWDWAAALRQLDQLTRGLTDPLAPSGMCEVCGAIRPVGSNCLRCGAEPFLVQTAPVAKASTPIEPLRTEASLPSTAPGSLLTSAPATGSSSGQYVSVTATPQTTEPPLATMLAATSAMSDAPVDVETLTRSDSRSWPVAGLFRRLIATILDVTSGVALGAIGAFGLLSILVASGSMSTSDDPRPLTFLILIAIVLLYAALGWSKGETLGMLVTRTRILRADDRRPAGLSQTFMRGLGSYVTIALGLIVFALITFINANLSFIQGTADLVVRIGAVVVGLYVIWLGSGQRILSRSNRQTLADRIAGTIVAIRQS